MVAHHLAVVGGEDDPGVVEDALAFEGFDDLPHLVVDGGDVGVVVAGEELDDVVREALPLGGGLEPAHEGVERPRLGDLGGNALADGDLDVAVEVDVVAGGVVGLVRPGETDPLEEGLVAVVLVDPLHDLLAGPGIEVGLVRQGRRLREPHGEAGVRGRLLGVGAQVEPLPVHLEEVLLLEVVDVLAVEAHDAVLLRGGMGLIEADLAVAGRDVRVGGELGAAADEGFVGEEVHLADAARVVAGLLEVLGEVGDVLGHVPVVLEDAVVADVTARQERPAGGHAEGTLAERAVEAHALGREAVDVGRADDVVAGAAEGVGAQLVGHDDHDVGPGVIGHCGVLPGCVCAPSGDGRYRRRW